MVERIRKIVCIKGLVHIMIITIAACIFMAPPVSAETHISTIYHVYLNDQRIGEVDDEELVTKAIDGKIMEIKKDLALDLELFPHNLSIVPEQVFDPVVNNAQTIKDIVEQVEIHARAYSITVDDEIVAYLSSEAEANKSTKQVKLKYIAEEELTEFEKREKNGKASEISNLKVGESMLTNIDLSGNFLISKTEVDPQKIVTSKEASEILTRGKQEEKIYRVKRGDMLSVIAKKHGLSLNEILALNPKVQTPSQIEVGQEIHVQSYQPYVSIITEEVELEKVEISYDYEVIADSSMFKGEQEVIQQGKEGEKVTKYAIISKDGQVTEKKVIGEEIVKSPIKHIVKKGTREITSRSTGNFIWPAVGGYISSKMGYRNGRPHKGIDIARPDERAILAADYGEVISAGWDGGYGNKVVINHGKGLTTVYAHLSSIGVKVGQSVAKGEKIGVMGTTGNSTGVHLHFEVLKDGQVQNPLDYIQ